MPKIFKAGEAPWETKSPKTFKAGEAPWETGQESVPMDWADRTPQLAEEAHPDVSWQDRAVIKNFANSPQAAAGFMNQKGFETELRGNDLYVRKPGEKEFKALDPKGFDVQDITDLGYDIPAGLVSGAATAAGGLAAAPTGVGAIPGAMLAGGTASAGLEALRQKLGGYLGLPQEVSGKQVAIAGGIGAAAPLVFGAGATAGQIAKGAAAQGIPEAELARQLSSPLLRGIKGTVKAAAGATSGVPAKAIDTYLKRQPEVDEMIANPHGAVEYSTSVYDQLQKAFYDKKREVGQKLGSAIAAGKQPIEAKRIFAPLEERIATLTQSERSLTPAGQAEIEALRAEITQLSEGLPEFIAPQTAFELQGLLKQNANLHNVKGTFQARYGAGASGAEKLWSDANADAYRIINKELDDVAATSGIKKEYAQLSQLQDKLQKYFKDPEKTYQTLSNIDAPSRGFAKKTAEEIKQLTDNKIDLAPSADLLQSEKVFRNPSLVQLSGGGTTSTTRTLTGTGVGGAIGAALGAPLGPFGAGIGSALGGAAGAVSTSPAAVKKGIQLYNRLPTIPQNMSILPARATPWLGIKAKE